MPNRDPHYNCMMPSVSDPARDRMEVSLSFSIPRISMALIEADGFDDVLKHIEWWRSGPVQGTFDNWLDNHDRSFHPIELALLILANASPVDLFIDPDDEKNWTLKKFEAFVKEWTTPDGNYELCEEDILLMRGMADAALKHDGKTAYRLGQKLKKAWGLILKKGEAG